MNRIFSITPGRSGIHYVKALCEHCTKLPDTATPEYFPEPICYEQYLDNSNTSAVKKELVRSLWSKFPKTFFSTSLLTKNGYLEALADLGARFVSLRRDTIENAYSWYLMNGHPGQTVKDKTWGRGVAYHPCIESPYNCLVVNDLEYMSVFQKCLWLVLETKARAQYIADMGADVYFVGLEDLNHEHEVIRFFEWMGIEYDLTNVDRWLWEKINPLKDSSRDLQENPHLDEFDKELQLRQLSNFISVNKGEIRI